MKTLSAALLALGLLASAPAAGKAVKGKSAVLKGDTILAVVDDKALKN
jgi:hypothetical protein